MWSSAADCGGTAYVQQPWHARQSSLPQSLSEGECRRPILCLSEACTVPGDKLQSRQLMERREQAASRGKTRCPNQASRRHAPMPFYSSDGVLLSTSTSTHAQLQLAITCAISVRQRRHDGVPQPLFLASLALLTSRPVTLRPFIGSCFT